MSVRTIQNGRFNGIRVQRTVAGEPVVKTWSYRIPVLGEDKTTTWRTANTEEQAEMLKQAELYDVELKEQQAAGAKERVYDPFGATERNNTGIRGLNFRLRFEYNSKIEVFAITIKGDDGKMHNRYHRIDTLGYEEAWNKAIDEIVRIKGLSEVVAKRMRSKMPKHSKLRELIEVQDEPVKRPRVLPASKSSGARSTTARRAR